jgi:NAD(P)-binding Rossmann-like domain
VLLVLTQAGDDGSIDHTWVVGVGTEAFRWSWLAADVVVATMFAVLHLQAQRSRYGLRYLPPPAFRALMALAEVLVLRLDRELAPAEVAGRVDRYLASFRARDKYRIRLAFLALAYWPLLTLHPPFHVMSADRRRRWVERRFLDETRDFLMPAWLRDVRRAMIRAAQQFCFFGYYGDERAARKAGYLPFSQRPGSAALIEEAQPARLGVSCLSHSALNDDTLRADVVVVVGSGAAGSILAHQLAPAGRRVLMLERGKHVDPSTFTEDESVQLSELYADGAMTMSKDFRVQVAQGMCVGGSTVVNNAVCSDLP